MKIRFTPDIIFVILLIFSLLFHFCYPVSIIVKYPFTIFGLFIAFCGFILVSISNSVLIKNKTSIKPLHNPDFLVTSGPFKFSRNPIYLGMMLILSGFNIFLGSLIILVFPALFVIIINKIIKKEELKLEEFFGEKYLNYKNKVGKWI